ncbi:hypothetical protein ILYODFUR_004450 [Ilyodon furcidens]|uniref:Uncharacterized protein n=1 Tax=Ilyodon furcidens TaxID=33524 RepID=A0ABV0UP20_9TELE
MRMGVVGDRGWGGGSESGAGSLRFRYQPRLAQPRFRCWGSQPVSTPGGKGTTSWVQGLVAPMRYQRMYGECELGLGLLPLLDQIRPPIKCGAYSLLATLPAGGWCLCPVVYLWFSMSRAGCFGVPLTPGGCFLGHGPLGSVGPLLGDCYVPGSLGPCLDLLRCRRLPAWPVGSSLKLPGPSACWLLGGSPGTPLCSSRRWFSWACCALGGLWMSVAWISSVSVPGPGGQVNLLGFFINSERYSAGQGRESHTHSQQLCRCQSWNVSTAVRSQILQLLSPEKEYKHSSAHSDTQMDAKQSQTKET